VLVGNRSESGIIILYSASEQGYLVLALYKHALLYYYYIYCHDNSLYPDIFIYKGIAAANLPLVVLHAVGLKKFPKGMGLLWMLLTPSAMGSAPFVGT